MKNSRQDYKGYIQKTQEFFNKYGENRSKEFIEYVKLRCDTKKRVFLDKKFMWMLYDDFCLIKNSGIRWYAIVGTGGTGKTTVAKNIGRFFDPSFNSARMCFDMDEMVSNLIKFPTTDAMKAICLDEPDQDIHPSSKKGKKARDILGKARQQKILALYCATDMYDIPDYIYKKITGIFFCNRLGKAIFYRDQPQHNIFIMSRLKILYKIHGYKAFYLSDIRKYGVSGGTMKETPLTVRDTDKYIHKKTTDYEDTLKEFKIKKTKDKMMSDRNKQIVQMLKRGTKTTTIANKFDISPSRVSYLKKKYGLN